jgi:hypothetical protein
LTKWIAFLNCYLVGFFGNSAPSCIPLVRSLVRPSVSPSVRLSILHTFVTDISASTGRNDFIFDIWLWNGDLYHVSPFQVYHTSTSCLPCNLQMNEWGYSWHDVACNILFFLIWKFNIASRPIMISDLLTKYWCKITTLVSYWL